MNPEISLMVPGLYHMSRGRMTAAFLWPIAIIALLPTFIGSLIVWVLCYRSALALSKSS